MKKNAFDHSPAITQPIYIVDGARTPFLKVSGAPGPFSASDLAVSCARTLLTRQNFNPTDLDEVIAGCIMPSENEANIGRLIALRLGCGNDMPGWTVQRNCGSGMQAIDSALKDILLGRADLVWAGGTEAMSRAPLMLNSKMVHWLGRWQKSKGFAAQLSALMKLRLNYFSPIIALLRGLTDPLFELNMGQTAEILAYQFTITREAMDAFALRSHQRLSAAQDAGYFTEIVPVFDSLGKCYQWDDGVRRDTTLEKLAKLRPVFDRSFGLVTAGNSSQVTDGAAFVILASERAVQQFKLPVLGRILDVEWAALSPAEMGLGPVFAATPLLRRNNLSLADIDYWEMNEAFAATVIACIKAWASDAFCKAHLGLENAFGHLDESKLNVDGGAVAIGHPVGASGARIVLHLLAVLKRQRAKRGVAAICIGGGQGGALLLESR